MSERPIEALALLAGLLVVGFAAPGGAPRSVVLVLAVGLFPALLLAVGAGRRRRLAAAGLAVALVVPLALVATSELSRRTPSPGVSAGVLVALVVVPLVWLVTLHARARERDAAR